MAGNANSGRRARSVVRAGVQASIDAAAPQCIQILIDYTQGRKELSLGQLDAVKYIVNQHIGSPKQRQDIDISAESGSGVTFMFINPKPVEIEPVEVKELPAPDGGCTENPEN
jgi:hypothetical protein